jgi:hypothetical protein
MTNKNNNRYVYMLSVDGFDWEGHHYDAETPFYIGNGSGKRIKDHVLMAKCWRGSNLVKGEFIRAVLAQGKSVIERKLFENLSLIESIKLEANLIVKWGRLDWGTGPLLNGTDGGVLAGGKNPSPLAREKVAEGARRRFEDPVEREKISAANHRRFENPVEREKQSATALVTFRNRWVDPQAREKQAARNRLRFEDPAERKKISEVNHRRYEDPMEREKTSVKTSAANRRRWSDPQARERMLKSQRRRWAIYYAKKREAAFNEWCKRLSASM